MATITLNIRALKAVALAGSTEEARYYLKGVMVDVTADSITYVATDGHRMMIAREAHSGTLTEDALVGRFIIPLDVIKGFKVPKDSEPGMVTLKAETEKRAYGTDPRDVLLTNATLSDGSIGRVFNSIDGSFPDWRRVVPSETSGEVGHFNYVYLADFQKAIEILNGRKTNCFVHVAHNGTGPAIVQGQTGLNFVGVVMPIRPPVNTGRSIPSWIDDRPFYQEAAE